ncbi:hypothetical protein ACWGJ2_40295 [Streptomyces sp. NPDC054796]
MNKPTAASVPLLTTAFYAFYDLHRPAYHAYAAARLPPEEAQIAVSQLFDLLASNWTMIVTKPRPAAWAWEQHTRAIARRTGSTPAPTEDAAWLHDVLHLSIERIGVITGAEPAAVTALVAAARRSSPRGPAPAPEQQRPGEKLRTMEKSRAIGPGLAPA